MDFFRGSGEIGCRVYGSCLIAVLFWGGLFSILGVVGEVEDGGGGCWFILGLSASEALRRLFAEFGAREGWEFGAVRGAGNEEVVNTFFWDAPSGWNPWMLCFRCI